MRRVGLLLCLLPSLSLAYHPGISITRGIYLHPGPLMSTGPWTAYDQGFSFVEDTAHSGRPSVRCTHPGSGIEGVGRDRT